MGQQDSQNETQRFGKFLRKVREERKLSLDAVEEMSIDYPDRLTKSHLSRIENGQAEPNFRKLFAMSQIYGMPLTALAEEYEIDLKRQLAPVDLSDKTDEEVETEARSLMEAGRYSEALVLLAAAVDVHRESPKRRNQGERLRWIKNFRLGILTCLVKLGRYEKAKQEAETILGDPDLDVDERLRALQVFVSTCRALSRFTVALMGLERAEAEIAAGGAPRRHVADFAVLRGHLMLVTGRPEDAIEPYVRALEIYEEITNPFEACRTRVNMASAFIEAYKYGHARQQAEAALLVAEASGYERLTALAMSHLSVIAYHSRELSAAQSWAIRSNAIARPREFLSVVFRNCYHLLLMARARGDETAIKLNENTLRAYVGRIEGSLREVEAFRAELEGGES